MSAQPHASAFAIAARAYQVLAAAKEHSAVATQTRRNRERDAHNRKATIIRLNKEEDADGVTRLLDGDDAAPPNPQRLKEIAELEATQPQIEGALPILRQRELAAEREVDASLPPFTGEIMKAVSMIQEPAAERIRSALAELNDPLRDLLMADAIRLGTIGERFSMPTNREPPFNGGIMVRKLLAAIPPRLCPENLTIDRVEAQARAAATTAICLIKENRK